MELTYVEKEMIKTEAITTIKELFEIPYIRAEMRELLLEMCDRLAEKTVPPLVVIACTGFEDIENVGEEEVQWTEEYAKSALTLILHMIPLDTSLINKLIHVWSSAPSIIKKTILGSLKAQISINDDNWLYAIDNCPQGGVLFPFDDKMETTQEDDISNIQQETELIGSTIPTTITTRIEPEDVHMEDAPPRTY